jgi:hypothetical protein
MELLDDLLPTVTPPPPGNAELDAWLPTVVELNNWPWAETLQAIATAIVSRKSRKFVNLIFIAALYLDNAIGLRPHHTTAGLARHPHPFARLRSQTA